MKQITILICLSILVPNLAVGQPAAEQPATDKSTTDKSPTDKSPIGQLKKGCNIIYTEDVQNILRQFKSVSSAAPIEDYKKFMITTKLHADIGFKLTDFDRSLTSVQRAELRTPLQRYSDCRTKLSSQLGLSIRTPGPPQRVLDVCDRTYAVLVQETLNRLKGKVSDKVLESYESFMIQLKYFEDLAFESGEFEKRTDYVTVGRLRLPLREYLTCRDTIIRIKSSRQ